MAIYAAGWILLAVAVLVAQMRFYNAHQRAHNLWRPRADAWVFVRTSHEYALMIRATLRRDADPGVERARRLYVGLLAAVVLYLVIGFPVVLALS
jgi:hypothetical protein